jgi:RND family efflux transporter MFP subunit
MIKKNYMAIFIFFILLNSIPTILLAEDKEKQHMTPNVVVSLVNRGKILPEREFIGTVYYDEVSDVSVELGGKVEIIKFDEGRQINKGAVLVKLDSELLEKRIQARMASYEQTLIDLEREIKNLERMSNLYRKKIIAEKDYDDQTFYVKSLEKKSAVFKSEVESLEIELKKTTIRSPFKGVVLKRHIARGEWVSPGMTIATIARDDVINMIVDVPAEIIRYLKNGMAAPVRADGNVNKGIINAVIPRGDVATRTFPVKIRLDKPALLMEGMEAMVRLPEGNQIDVLLVPRDSLLTTSERSVVVVVIDSKAVIVPVEVVGYQGMSAGIRSEKISEGMKVVVKGNERLIDGQLVTMIEEAH